MLLITYSNYTQKTDFMQLFFSFSAFFLQIHLMLKLKSKNISENIVNENET